MCSSKHKFAEMVCKEDVIAWFRELESYKRIDTMCTLLNMCLPFELRFLGTVLEELGRRDAQELRGVELRVNNQQEFASDIQICHNGDPNDRRVRRKMALYLALLRATFNRTCINELFTTLEQWGEGEFTNFADGDPLQELLLVYTMATNHPIFTFEQRAKCGNVLQKVKVSKNLDTPTQPTTQHGMQQATTIPQQLASPSTAGYPLPGQYLHNSTSTPPLFQMMAPNPATGYPQPPMSQIISDNLATHMTVEMATQLHMAAAAGQAPNVIPMPTDFSMPPPTAVPWGIRPQHNYVGQPFQSMSLEGSFHQSTSSPMLSQPSSPAHSRTTSPNRVSSVRGNADNRGGSNTGGDDSSSRSSTTGRSDTSDRIQGNSRQQQQQRGSLRNSRRPSIDSTPPPQQQQQQQQQQSQMVTIVGNEVIIPQNLKADFNDVIGDVVLNQLQQIRNGYSRPMIHTIARQSNKQQSYMQHSQQQSSGLPYAFQNMQLNADMSVHPVGVMPHHKSGGSDSGSGSGGEISPPETPSNMSGMSGSSERRDIVGNNRRGMRGMNGRQQQQQGQSQGAGSGIKGEPQQQQQGSVIYSTTTPLAGQFSAGDQQLLMASNNVAGSLISSNSQNNLQQLAGTMVTHGGNVTQSPTAFVSASTATSFPPGAAYQLATNRSLPAQLLYIQQPIQFIPTQQQQQHQQPLPSGANITPNMRSSPSLQIPPPTLASVSPQMQQSTPNALTNSSAYPTNKMNQSCFNCGSTSHNGRECQEASMEDVTRTSIYKLDYNSSSGNAPGSTTSTGGTPNQTTPGTAAAPTTTIGQTDTTTGVSNTTATTPTTQPGTIAPKIKPHFNPDIVPQSAIDQDEIIDLISDSSSNGSRK